MSEEVNLSIVICENSIIGYLMVCRHSPKKIFEF